MGVQPIIFTLQSATPYSLCYEMSQTGAQTTILPSATLLADARSAFPSFTTIGPLLEVLLTPVADDTEADNIMTRGATPPAISRTKHCWCLLMPVAESNPPLWTINGTRDAGSGLPELTIAKLDSGTALLWIRRQHTYDI